ncbi:hypothetical protein ACT3UD_18110 [Glutamicibacter sp. 287]|uniref:hypothetical protein n=1 Tax=unclassified Glutamicibacter TaxID=2627139 RepID=UPI0040340767
MSAEELKAYSDAKQSQNIWNKAKSYGHSLLEGAKNTMSSIGQGELVKNDGDFSLSELGGATLAGALPGGVTAYKPKWLKWSTMKTFKYGNYRSGYNHSPEVLNRVGNDKYKLGAFWAHDMPQNLDQVRTDKALPLFWEDKAFEMGYDPNGQTSYTMRYQAKFEEYTEKYGGRVAPQRDGKYRDVIYPGGTEQIYIPPREWVPPKNGEPMPEKGTVINESPLPQ